MGVSGNSNGSIRMFGPDEDGQVVFLDRKLIHGAPITDMSSYKHNLVSCDESGCTVLSKFDCGELMIVARSNIFGGLVEKRSEKSWLHHSFKIFACILDIHALPRK